jgi:hypothetical protein
MDLEKWEKRVLGGEEALERLPDAAPARRPRGGKGVGKKRAS